MFLTFTQIQSNILIARAQAAETWEEQEKNYEQSLTSIKQAIKGSVLSPEVTAGSFRHQKLD